MDVISIYHKMIKFLSQDKIKIEEPMSNHTSFRIGGPADLLIIPEEIEEVQQTISMCKENDIPFLIMGNGTNLLVNDSGIRGVVIKVAQNFNDAKVDKNRIRCRAGMPLSSVAKIALENNLKGLEFAHGIPGTVGGATVMNAGAYDGEMANVVAKVMVMDHDGNVYDVLKEELKYSYRQCNLQKGDKVLLEVEIELVPGNHDEIKAKMEDFLERRRRKQPLNLPSAGSTFKRPPGNYAGYLIEKAGLKGYRKGGAMVSDMHAGFIVNANNATFEDVINLMDYVKAQVKLKFDVDLEPEVKIIGH